MTRVMRVACVLLTLVAASGAQAVQAEPSVTNARIGENGNTTRFVLDMTESASFQVLTLADPYRLVVELPPVRWQLSADTLAVEHGLIGYVRFGQYQPDVSRVVLDLTAPAYVRDATLIPPRSGYQYRLVVDLEPISREAFRESIVTHYAAGTPEAQSLNSAAADNARPPAPDRSGTQRSGDEPVAKVSPVASVDRLPAERSKDDNSPKNNTLNGKAVAQEQVQTAAIVIPPPAPPRPHASPPPRRRVIAVDAGHGGGDPGALGLGGQHEKHLTLKAAKELKRQLEATGRYEVVLTRKRDVFVSLRRRVEIARKAGADLFISLHADHHDNPKVRGASVYTLSDKASDAEAEQLARRENKSGLVSGVDLSEGYDAEVAQILISLVQQTTLNCSATFATLHLVPELSKNTKLLGKARRFAGFRVLKAPDIPSVLLELGYLSNSQDRERLTSSTHRAALLKRVVVAIDAYFATSSC